MNVRRHSQRRHARRRELAEPTIRQLLRSLEAYARARAEASATEGAYLQQLRSYAEQLSRELTRDLELAGAAYVHVSWDLEADAPTYERVDPRDVRPTRTAGEVVAERIAASPELRGMRELWRPRTWEELEALPPDA